MKWLCKIGLHSFKPWALNSVVNPIPIERCGRCGVGRQAVLWGGQIRYTRAEMDEAARSIEANQPGEPAEVEYWVEPIPGLGGRVPPFKAASKEAGLRFISNNRHSPLYQLRPRRVNGR